jgi:hypothetical protein
LQLNVLTHLHLDPGSANDPELFWYSRAELRAMASNTRLGTMAGAGPFFTRASETMIDHTWQME